MKRGNNQALYNILLVSECKTTLKCLYIYVHFLRFKYKLLSMKLQAFCKHCNNILANQLGKMKMVLIRPKLYELDLSGGPLVLYRGKKCLSCHKLCFLNPTKQLRCVLLVQYISIHRITRTSKLFNALVITSWKWFKTYSSNGGVVLKTCFRIFSSFITVIKCFYMLSLGYWYSWLICLHAYLSECKDVFALECSSFRQVWLICNHGAINTV